MLEQECVLVCVSETLSQGSRLYLHGRDVCVGHVAVDVLDLRDVLLSHLDALRARRLVAELR